MRRRIFEFLVGKILFLISKTTNIEIHFAIYLAVYFLSYLTTLTDTIKVRAICQNKNLFFISYARDFFLIILDFLLLILSPIFMVARVNKGISQPDETFRIHMTNSSRIKKSLRKFFVFLISRNRWKNIIYVGRKILYINKREHTNFTKEIPLDLKLKMIYIAV